MKLQATLFLFLFFCVFLRFQRAILLPLSSASAQELAPVREPHSSLPH